MKKVLSTALALGLIAGVASTAAAAFDSFSVTGYYQVEGNYATNMDRIDGVDLHTAAQRDTSSAWWNHEFRIYPVLKVNDKITMKSEIRVANGDWGSDEAGFGQTTNTDWDKLYMEYVSPVGMLRMGIIPWGTFGTKFIDSGSRNTGIVWFPSFVQKPFNMVVAYAKITEGDSDSTAPAAETDGDNDYADVRLGYTTDMFDGQVRVGVTDNQATANINDEKWHVGGYANVKLTGTTSASFEFDHTFGDTQTDGAAAIDYDAWAAYADVTTKVNNITMGALAWFLSGDNDTDATSNDAFGHAGQDFNPLLIATGDDFGLLNDETGSGGAGVYDTAVTAAGQVAVGAFASMAISDKLNGTVVVGSAWADDEAATWDDHYGYEIDLILSYKLLDNLVYTANFGYFDAGDLFDMAAGAAGDALEDEVVLVNHTLNMKF